MYNYNSFLTPGLPDYSQPNQQGQEGQSLAAYNSDGSPVTYDTQNDSRTPFQIKNDHQQTMDILNDKNDTDGYYVSDAGNKYTLVDNSENAQLKNGIFSYFMGWLNSGGDVAKATDSLYGTLDGLDQKAKRQAKINDLEKAGYSSAAIGNYVDDGDKKALTNSKGQWKAQGGYMVNDLTGEVKALPQTAAQQETARHNQATESAATDKQAFEQQKYGNEQRQVDHTIDEGNVIHIIYKDGTESFQPKGLSPDQQAKATDKATAAREGKEEQIYATATNAKQAQQFGTDIVSDPNLQYAGPGWKNRASNFLKSGVGNDNPMANVDSKVSQYNHNLQVLGQAALYTEAGTKRIFAKEMDAAGYKFVNIDTTKMNDAQIKAAVANNDKIINMYADWENRISSGKSPVAKSTETNYNDQGHNPTPAANGGAPQAALDHLRSNPALAPQFRAKYGYLPAGY